MENTAGQRKNNLLKSLFRSLLFYTPVSFGYLGFIALTINNSNKTIAAFAGLLLKNLALLLVFSLVFGFSMQIFNLKRMSNAAKWTLHIVVLYATTLGCFLSITDASSTPSGTVLFIFISTLLFALIYSISALIVYIRKRKRRY
jgi:hypothetical protein